MRKARNGAVAATPVIVKYRDSRTDPDGARGVDPVALTRALVDLDSTTGREGEVGRWLADYLRDLGFSVTTQPVDDLRFNILATVGSPQVVFSTHFDCVPPFFPSRIDGDRLYGRGSCDAKGILAAQIAAADALPARGRDPCRPAVRRRRGARQRRGQDRERRRERVPVSD